MIESAPLLVSKIAERYGTCRSYRDFGVAKKDGKIIYFSTMFVRPEQFLLRYTTDRMSDTSACIKTIRCIDGKVQSRFNYNWCDSPNLSCALIAHGAASFGVSSFVDRLLFRSEADVQWGEFLPYSYFTPTDTDPNIAVVTSNTDCTQATEVLRIDLANRAVVSRDFSCRSTLDIELPSIETNMTFHTVEFDLLKTLAPLNFIT